ncbi:MAG: PHP domain-containing protein [Candidatus Aenigmatarchaeota archaeon]
MKFDMHTHTVYSRHWFWGVDAINTPQEMVDAAIAKGLGGIAVTDHNCVKGSLAAEKYAKSLGNDFKIITGSEIRSASGDILALGIREDVKPGMSVEETVDSIRDLGGIAVAPHPFSEFLFRQCVGKDALKADAVEAFNASSSLTFQNMKAEAFAAKHGMPVCAGSDSHCTRTVGNAGISCEGDPIEDILGKKAEIFGKRTGKLDMIFLISKKYGRSMKWRLVGKDRGKQI